MDNLIVLDIETTGVSPENDRITEIGAIKVMGGQVVETFSQLINPQVDIPVHITELTGISNDMVKNMPTIREVLPKFISFCGDLPIMGHNIMFDYSFLVCNAAFINMEFKKYGLDTLMIARQLLPTLESRSLTALCKHFNIIRDKAHRAYDDAYATYELYLKLKQVVQISSNPSCFEPKELVFKPKKQEPITEKQKKYLAHLVQINNVKLVKPISEYTKSEASREIDAIIRQYGRESV